jgi:hypothetical protein
MLKGLQSKYESFSARQVISCDQAIRTITIDLHLLDNLKMCGALPLYLHGVDSDFTLSLLSSESIFACYFP